METAKYPQFMFHIAANNSPKGRVASGAPLRSSVE